MRAAVAAHLGHPAVAGVGVGVVAVAAAAVSESSPDQCVRSWPGAE